MKPGTLSLTSSW